MLYYLDGKIPVKTTDLHEWGMHLTFDNRIIAFDEINGIQISTVFLGVDHGHGHGEPLLFETLIDDTEIEIYRYSTWEQAEKGHSSICSVLKSTKGLSMTTEEKQALYEFIEAAKTEKML